MHPAHITQEIQFPGDFKLGATGQKVRQLQEWLNLHSHGTAVDGRFGDATRRALATYQTSMQAPIGDQVDLPVWKSLVAPIVGALSAVPTGMTLPQAVLEVARAHLEQHPAEVGGDNKGPWVRLYMEGNEGSEWRWCAGFVCFALAQACRALGRPMPFKRSFSCDKLAARAEAAGLLVPGEDIASGRMSWSDMGPCSIFLVRRTSDDWSHTGFAFDGSGTSCATLEGNTNDDGSANGYEVCARSRSVAGKDFIRLPA